MSARSRMQRRRLRFKRRLIVAQEGLCAGCATGISLGDHGPRDCRKATLDHVVPRAKGGGDGLFNMLLKHKPCNEARGSTDPTGCDRIWQMAVHARMGLAA